MAVGEASSHPRCSSVVPLGKWQTLHGQCKFLFCWPPYLGARPEQPGTGSVLLLPTVTKKVPQEDTRKVSHPCDH